MLGDCLKKAVCIRIFYDNRMGDVIVMHVVDEGLLNSSSADS